MSSQDNKPNEKSDVREVKKKKSFSEKQQERVAHGLVQSAKEELSESWFKKYTCCHESLGRLFKINTSDFFQRFLCSFVPFNYKFHELVDENPDAWGPIWIYTTIVFTVAASGSIQKYLGESVGTSKGFFQKFIPISAGIVYGIGFFLPLLLLILMKCFGSKSRYVNILCIYGYSYSVLIPVLIACSAPIGVWIFYLVHPVDFTSLCDLPFD